MFLLTSCGNGKSEPSASAARTDAIFGDFIRYPENPPEQLRDALLKDVRERSLPLTIGEVEQIEFERKECAQITIGFGSGSENLCVISFTVKHLDDGYDESLSGYENVAFTLAFKDSDNAQDMVTVLTSVIKYLSPDLSLEEAERLANNQDRTLGTDGWSQPADIGGYQVQARYTNPLIFVNTPDFEAKLGVSVRAIAQLWGPALATLRSHELTEADVDLLTTDYPPWEEDSDEPLIVYADFYVRGVSEHESYLHGESWWVVDIESMDGQKYSISLDTWAFPNTYEFGIGQRYTLFINRKYISGVSGGITYAIQRSESTEFNSRGFQSLDYFTYGYDTNWWRVEPEEEGTVYNVYFALQSQTWGQVFAALEGQGIGKAQWPASPPGWDGYTFVGWYDNTDWNGEPYTKDTPIYKDTYLHARWKYTGSGGAWPRAYHGDVKGVEHGSEMPDSSEVTITASGYNTALEAPGDQRFRWTPVSWRLPSGKSGAFSESAPFTATLKADTAGEQTLYVTYMEEIYDSNHWQKTGQVRETAAMSSGYR
ncbi:hypothetical protein FACS189490_09560 [Clostridia bacterium]|nr:hypothetical protein FACS189490_09560 [Clostridia bacterium]